MRLTTSAPSQTGRTQARSPVGDSSRLAEDRLLANARQWLLAQLVVIRHANLPR